MSHGEAKQQRTVAQLVHDARHSSHDTAGSSRLPFASRQWIVGVAFSLLAQPVFAETPGEARFFKDCPHRRYVRVHDETRPWDLHTILYTMVGLSEVEVFRAADWIIDLPLPGRPLQPFQRTMWTIRRGYNQLPPWGVRQRVGELADALQLPQLSFGDANATYTVTTGGTTGPGSGVVVRVSKLIDWTQHITGDVNQLLGWPIRRPQGLITWSGPERVVDGGQWVLLKTFNNATIWISRTVDGGLTGLESIGERVVNVGFTRPHEEETVFLRLPIDVYRAHELWILERRSHVVLGTAEEFVASTHAAMAHRQRKASLPDWSPMDRPEHQPSLVMVMMSTRTFSHAPQSLRSYVVPAAWVLDEAEGPSRD